MASLENISLILAPMLFEVFGCDALSKAHLMCRSFSFVPNIVDPWYIFGAVTCIELSDAGIERSSFIE